MYAQYFRGFKIRDSIFLKKILNFSTPRKLLAIRYVQRRHANCGGTIIESHIQGFEGDGQVVVLEHRVIIVENSQVVGSLDEELIGHAQVIHVVDRCGHQSSKHLQLREHILHNEQASTYMYIICTAVIFGGTLS